jgi:DNA-binding MarR family transcriptional regulator
VANDIYYSKTQDFLRPGSSGTAYGEDLQNIAADLRIIIGRLSRRLRSERQHSELSLSQISALFSLERLGPISPTALSKIERVKPPSMTKIVASLLENDLAQKTHHESDGRQFLIEITPNGQDILNKDRREKEAWLAKALSSLTATDISDITKALRALESLVEM